MRTEVPVFKRCCFCLPLRYGLLTWGYIKLITSSIVSIALLLTLYKLAELPVSYSNPPITRQIIVLSIVLAIMVGEVVLNIFFIVGGHKKNVKLLRVFYVYNLVIFVLTILVVVVCALLMIRKSLFEYLLSFRSWILLLDLSAMFINVIMQTYFLLLLRSEIMKLRSACQFRFVNNAAESECAMKYNEEDVDGENGIKDISKETNESLE